MVNLIGTGKGKGSKESGRSSKLSSLSRPSNLLLYDPTQPPPTFTRGSSQLFSDEDEPLTLVQDLEENRDRYRAPLTDSVTVPIRSFSDKLTANIERLQQIAPDRPSRNMIISACIFRGVVYLRKDERVKELINARDRFKIAPSDVDPDIYYIIRSLASITSISGPGLSRGRINVSVPREIAGMIGGLADDIGINNTNLVTLLVMIELASEESTLKKDREELHGYAKGFFKGIKARTGAINQLLEVYGL